MMEKGIENHFVWIQQCPEPIEIFRNLVALAAVLNLIKKFTDAYHSPADSAASDFLKIIPRSNSDRVEAPVVGIQYRLCSDLRADTAGGAMFNVNGRPDGDLIAFAIGLQRVERGRFHQANHVWRGVHSRQFRMMSRQSVLKLDRLFSLASRTDGNGSCHSVFLQRLILRDSPPETNVIDVRFAIVDHAHGPRNQSETAEQIVRVFLP